MCTEIQPGCDPRLKTESPATLFIEADPVLIRKGRQFPIQSSQARAYLRIDLIPRYTTEELRGEIQVLSIEGGRILLHISIVEEGDGQVYSGDAEFFLANQN